MKLQKSFISIILLVLILAQALSLNIFAAPEVYSSTSNSGVRGEVCTSVSGTGVSDYYAGDYAIDTLIALDDKELLSALRTLMVSTHTRITTYDSCRDYADETACENGDGKVVTIYTSYSASYSEYQGGSGWNREHVWPKSIGGFGNSGGGADLHHIRPSENRVNSTRGNKKYGNVTSGKTVTGNMSGLVGGEYSQYFEPLDEVKGDVARICLYVYVRWGGEYSQSSNILNVFESVDTLLEWCALDPVDTWEMGRNEVVEEIQGNRNVFIDYPELAWLLFGREVPTDIVTPTGLAKSDTELEPAECSHPKRVIKNVVDATCVNDGYTGDVCCETCGEVILAGDVAPATSHKLDTGVVIIEPTETSVGYRKHVCANCDHVEMVELPKLSTAEGCTAYVASYSVSVAAIALFAALVTKKKRR